MLVMPAALTALKAYSVPNMTRDTTDTLRTQCLHCGCEDDAYRLGIVVPLG